MSDETKTENENTSTQTDGEQTTTVNITQDKLDKLINEKFAKGAEKATKELLEGLGVENQEQLKEIIEAKKAQDEASKSELEKLQEQLDGERQARERLEKERDNIAKEATIKDLALSNGIQDVEVFEALYNSKSNSEGFDGNAFVDGLRESKPYLFNKGTAPKTDNSPNRGDTKQGDFAERVKNAKTKAELDALYNEIGA